MMILNIDIIGFTRIAAWTTFGLLIFFILYRKLLAKLKEGRINREFFFILHPIEKNPAQGNIQILLEMHQPIEIEVTIINNAGEIVKTIDKKLYTKGKNIINLNTIYFANGSYFYQAQSADQKTRKQFYIQNP